MSSQNPVFALLASLLVLSYLKVIAGRKPADRAVLTTAIVVTVAVGLVVFNVGLRLGLMPGGLLLFAFMLVFHFLRRRENTMMLVGSVIGAVALVLPAMGFAVLHFRNGVEGMRSPTERLAFYVLYPLGLGIVACWRVFAP
jgi:hypothetical protein